MKACIIAEPRAFDAWIAFNAAEWTQLASASVALGQFDAAGRIAQLIVQLRDRLHARGLIYEETCAFPLRQSHIADATGLTTVHVSRMISAFRKDQIFEIEDGRLRIFDLAKLRRIGECR